MGCWLGLITDQARSYVTSLSAWTVIKDIYRAEPWIVLHGWSRIEPMARWIQWVKSSWNIGTDWSPIVIICRWFRWFRLSHNRPRWRVLPMYRSSSTRLPRSLPDRNLVGFNLWDFAMNLGIFSYSLLLLLQFFVWGLFVPGRFVLWLFVPQSSFQLSSVLFSYPAPLALNQYLFHQSSFQLSNVHFIYPAST